MTKTAHRFGTGPAAPDFTPQLVTAIATAGRQVAWPGKALTLYNRSPAVTVYLGPEGFDPFGQAVHVLDPLSSVPVDGSTVIWAQTRSGSAVVQASPGLGAITPSPAQIAAQIFLSGVPLSAAAALLTQQVLTIPGGGLIDLQFTADIGQLGYEASLQYLCDPAETSPFVQAAMVWGDSQAGGGQTIAEEEWVLTGATAAFPYVANGPAKGDSLSLNLTNNGTKTATVGVVLAQNSRVYAADDWHTISGPAPATPGFTYGAMDPSAGLLSQGAPNVNAAATQNRLLPLYNGTAAILVTSGGGTCTAVLTPLDPFNAGINQPIWQSGAIAANGFSYAQVPLPRVPCQLALKNTGGAAQNIGFAVTSARTAAQA